MISSMNAYSGQTAAQLLSLFVVTPPSSGSANSTLAPLSASSSPLASIGGAELVVTDPAGTIKQILAHAQMQNSSTLTLGGSASIPSSDGPTFLQLGNSDLIQSPSTSVISTISHTDVDTLGDGLASSGINVSSLSAGSATAAAFQINLSFSGQSLSVDFAVAGIGPITQSNGANNFSAGNGDSAVTLEAGIGSHQMGINDEINISGLTVSQAHALVSTFESVTAIQGQKSTSSSNPLPDGYATQFNSSAISTSDSYYGFTAMAGYGTGD